LRAGLLSKPAVIQQINDRFVSTWILKEDMKRLADAGDDLAKVLAANFEHPLDLMFLTSEGKLISRLNSFHDFPMVHPDVTMPPFKRRGNKPKLPHVDIFFEHIVENFGNECVVPP